MGQEKIEKRAKLTVESRSSRSEQRRDRGQGDQGKGRRCTECHQGCNGRGSGSRWRSHPTRAREVLKDLAASSEGDRAIGINLVYDALAAPTGQISANAGADGDEVISKILEDDENFGYNARSGEYVDMIESGILDPAKVTRNALESAGSIAGLVLTMRR